MRNLIGKTLRLWFVDDNVEHKGFEFKLVNVLEDVTPSVLVFEVKGGSRMYPLTYIASIKVEE